MTVLQKIKDDTLFARKNKDAVKSSLLTTLYSEAVKVGKDKDNRESTDDEVYAVINYFIKNNTKTLEVATDPLVKSVLETENYILNSYLPQKLSDFELKIVISNCMDTIRDQPQKSVVGLVMKYLSSNYNNRFDAKVANRIIQAEINNVNA